MPRIYLPHSWDYRSSDVENQTKVFLSPAQLENHAVARARMSLIAGVDLALLKANGLILPGGIVTKAGASYQDDRGKQKEKTSAAHALPCSIEINGIMLDKLPTLKNLIKVQTFVVEPYRYTNIVPISVNNADSRAEAYGRKAGTGLVANFVDFCNKVLTADAFSSRKVNRASLQAAFAELIRQSQESFEIALSRKEQATPTPFFKGLREVVWADFSQKRR
jgi:hypothetical protein